MGQTFTIYDDETGVFEYTGHQQEELDRVLDIYDEHDLSDQGLLTALKRLLNKAPDLIEAHAHIASILDMDDKPKKALEAALRGLAVADRVIPGHFSGRIEWGHLSNRPYLQLMHVAVESYTRLGRYKDAAAMIDTMLQRNPNDNQGMRWQLGSALMRTGDHDRARRVFKRHTEYPPYCYELALYHILHDDWVAAATSLRRGFVTNPYIAEMLTGNTSPAPLAIWHGTNLTEPDTAEDYLATYGSLWLDHPEGMFFVRWLFNHPKVLAERGAIMAYREALLWERDTGERSRLLGRCDELIVHIDDTLSASIVTRRQDRSGNLVWPWEYRP